MKHENYDVVIVGGGIVGLTVAALLAEQTPLTMAIIESHTVDLSWNTPFDLRVSAINRASEKIFNSAGVWNEIISLGVSDYQQMKVWDPISQGQIEFDCADVVEPNLGYVIEHRVLLKALTQHLIPLKQVKFFCPAKPQKLIHQTDGNMIEINEQSIKSKLLVGADGAHSWLRQQADIAITEQSYGHDALITTVHTEKPHQKTAWQCFLPEGVIALLPLIDQHHCSVVWSATPSRVTDLQAMTEQSFNQAITAVFADYLGNITKVDGLQRFPLYKRHVKHYVQSHLALVGDAAHTIHPLAGQGINLGLTDAACLVEVIKESLQKQRSIGDLQILRRYERWRKSENWNMIIAMDIFKNLFTNSWPALNPIKKFGLNIVHKTSFIKNFFIRYALGLQNEK